MDSDGHRIAGCGWNGDGLLLMRVEVRTATGDWHTCRLPGQLVGPMLCVLPN